LITHVKRQLPYERAANVLSKYGGQICFGVSRFSAKWLGNDRPISVRRRIRRRHALTRFLEFLGCLPRLYAVVAHFDADENTFTIYGAQHLGPMQRAAGEISETLGVEVKVIKRESFVVGDYA
jgi:hypothetical protein